MHFYLLKEFTLISILSFRYFIFDCYWTRFEKFCEILILVWKNLVFRIEPTRNWLFVERIIRHKTLVHNNEHLISIWFFLLIRHWILFENYFKDIKSRKSSSILMKIREMSFSKAISVPLVFQYQSKIIRVIN